MRELIICFMLLCFSLFVVWATDGDFWRERWNEFLREYRKGGR